VARAVHEYLDAHATNLERVARLEEKAERLEKAGTPSESVRNRAERARAEVVAGLAALRVSFVKATGGRNGAYAFDRVVEQRCPSFTPHSSRRTPQGFRQRSL
jgi:seryl-tRNA(Sec) selenium transferase